MLLANNLEALEPADPRLSPTYGPQEEASLDNSTVDT